MRHEFDTGELRALIQGKFDFWKCLDCDGKGWVWVDGDIGEVVNAPDTTEDKFRFYKDCCDSCLGLGGFLRIQYD